MVSDTINTERFLFLKKSLCLLEIIRLKRIVKINDATVDHKELYTDINNELLALRDTFTIPTLTLRKGVSVINLDEIHLSIKDLLSSKNLPNLKNRQIQEKDIYFLPDRENLFIEMADEFKAKNGLWGDIRHAVSGIINHAQYMMDAISAFVEYRESDMTLSMAIYFLNTLEYIDWVFSLSEDGEGVFSDKTIPGILEVDHDD